MFAKLVKRGEEYGIVTNFSPPSVMWGNGIDELISADDFLHLEIVGDAQFPEMVQAYNLLQQHGGNLRWKDDDSTAADREAELVFQQLVNELKLRMAKSE
jgi:hypothetical protein